jgi:hypothetical protein
MLIDRWLAGAIALFFIGLGLEISSLSESSFARIVWAVASILLIIYACELWRKSRQAITRPDQHVDLAELETELARRSRNHAWETLERLIRR